LKFGLKRPTKLEDDPNSSKDQIQERGKSVENAATPLKFGLKRPTKLEGSSSKNSLEIKV